MGMKEMVSEMVEKILGNTPEGRKALAAKEAERRQARAGAVKELKNLKKRVEKEHPGLYQRIEETRSVMNEAQKQLNAAIGEHEKAGKALHSFNHSIHAEEKELERLLRDTADPEIDKFLLECSKIPRDAFKGPQEQVSGRIVALREARSRAEKLKLEDLSPEEVAREILHLRESLPELQAIAAEVAR